MKEIIKENMKEIVKENLADLPQDMHGIEDILHGSLDILISRYPDFPISYPIAEPDIPITFLFRYRIGQPVIPIYRYPNIEYQTKSNLQFL